MVNGRVSSCLVRGVAVIALGKLIEELLVLTGFAFSDKTGPTFTDPTLFPIFSPKRRNRMHVAAVKNTIKMMPVKNCLKVRIIGAFIVYTRFKTPSGRQFWG